MLKRDEGPAKQLTSKVSAADAEYAKVKKALDAAAEKIEKLSNAALQGVPDKAKFDAGVKDVDKALAAVVENATKYEANNDQLVKAADKALKDAQRTRRFAEMNTPKDADLNYRSAMALQEASESYDKAYKHVKQAEGLFNEISALEYKLVHLKNVGKTSTPKPPVSKPTPTRPSNTGQNTGANTPGTTSPKPSANPTVGSVDEIITNKAAQNEKTQDRINKENDRRNKETDGYIAGRNQKSDDFANEFNRIKVRPFDYMISPRDGISPAVTTTYVGDRAASAGSNYTLGKNTPSWVKLVDPATAKLEITPPRAAEGKSFNVEIVSSATGETSTVTFNIAKREDVFAHSYTARLGYDMSYPSGMESFRTNDVVQGATRGFALNSGSDMVEANPNYYEGPLTYKIDKAPKWVTIDAKTGKLNVAPGKDVTPGTYQVTTKVDLGDGVVVKGASTKINVVVDPGSFAENRRMKPKLAADPYAKENRADSYKQSVQFDKSYFPDLPVGLYDAPRNIVNIGETQSFPLIGNRDWVTADDFSYTGKMTYHIRDNIAGWVEINEKTGELTVSPKKGMRPGEYTIQTYVDLGDGVIVYRPDTTINVTEKDVDKARPSKDASTSEILSYLKQRANR